MDHIFDAIQHLSPDTVMDVSVLPPQEPTGQGESGMFGMDGWGCGCVCVCVCVGGGCAGGSEHLSPDTVNVAAFRTG